MKTNRNNTANSNVNCNEKSSITVSTKFTLNVKSGELAIERHVTASDAEQVTKLDSGNLENLGKGILMIVNGIEKCGNVISKIAETKEQIGQWIMKTKKLFHHQIYPELKKNVYKHEPNAINPLTKEFIHEDEMNRMRESKKSAKKAWINKCK